MTRRPSTESSRASLLKVETQQVQGITVSQYLGSPSRMSSIPDYASATGTMQLHFPCCQMGMLDDSSPAQIGALSIQIYRSIGASATQLFSQAHASLSLMMHFTLALAGASSQCSASHVAVQITYGFGRV